MVNLATLTVEDFIDHVGTAWPCAGSDMALTLTEARVFERDYGIQSPRKPFSLMFKGPAGIALGQGIYPLCSPGHGNLELFMVPVAQADDAIMLQAIFN